MKEVNIKLTPIDDRFPTREFKQVTDVTTVSDLYHQDYKLEVTSDWYEDIDTTYKHTEKEELTLNLNVRQGEVIFSVPKGFKIVVDSYVADGNTLALPYDDEPYNIVLSHPYYKEETVQVKIDPSNTLHEIKDVDLERLKGKIVITFTDRHKNEWTESFDNEYGDYTIAVNKKGYVGLSVNGVLEEPLVNLEQYVETYEETTTTERKVIPFETIEEKDDTLLANESYVKQEGEDGEREHTYNHVVIDGEITSTEEVKTEVLKEPINEIKVIGVKDVQWVKELKEEKVLPFERIVKEDDSVLPEKSYIQTQGIDGKEKIFHEVEYVNGNKTGETRNETTERIEPTHEVYIQGTQVVEWKREVITTEVIPFGRTTQEDNEVLPEDSYVKTAGVDGVKEISYEYKFVNGKKTDERRNREEETVKEVVNEIYIKGTMVIEWKKEVSSTATIPFTTEYVDDNTLDKGLEKTITQGKDGVRTYYREYKYVNGKKTTEYRNETSSITTAMIAKVIARGTKVTEWKKEQYRVETISYTTKYVDDNTIDKGKEVVQTEGRNGMKTYYREYEYVNDNKTGNWRNETSVTTVEMIERVVARGTKRIITPPSGMTEVLLTGTVPIKLGFGGPGARTCLISVGNGIRSDGFQLSNKVLPFSEISELFMVNTDNRTFKFNTIYLGMNDMTYSREAEFSYNGNEFAITTIDTLYVRIKYAPGAG